MAVTPALHGHLILFILFLLLSTPQVYCFLPRSSITRHPLRNLPGATPPILSIYETRRFANLPRRRFVRGAYFPRSSRYILRDPGNGNRPPKSKRNMLRGYDVLAFHMGGAKVDDWLTMELNRACKVCIVVHAEGYRFGQTVKIDGWNMIGLAEWEPGVEKLQLKKKKAHYKGNPTSWGFVGCRDAKKGKYTIPHAALLKGSHKIVGYSVLLGEKDGSPSKKPAVPKGWADIKPQTKCPVELHNMWTVENPEGDNDKDVKGIKWLTWHPQVDPIYWCYYGHEHGSDPGMAGYEARFHYTAYKTNRQKESHNGFKGYVVPENNSIFYFNVHALTSAVRRVDEIFHTVVIAATDRKTGELQMELSCKGNFGFSFTPLKDKYVPPFPAPPVLGIGKMNEKMVKEAYAKQWSLSKRRIQKRINVIDVKNLDKRLIYETDFCSGCPKTNEFRLRGRYETWRSAGPQLCMKSSKDSRAEGFTVDIKDPATGCRSVNDCTLVDLGIPPDDNIPVFRRGLGIIRDIAFESTHIGERYCSVNIPRRGSDYVFYTDPYCKKVLNGPGPNAVRQVMKHGFKAYLNAGFGVNDPWGTRGYSKNRDCLVGCPEDQTFFGYQDIEGAIEEDNA